MTSHTMTPVQRRHPQQTAHQIDIVVPVHNEQAGLEPVRWFAEHLKADGRR